MTSKAHPKMNQLTDYALGLLPADELGTIADHINDCQQCQETLSNLADPSDTLIQGLRGKAPDDAFPEEPEYERALAAVQEFGHTSPPDMTVDQGGSQTDIVPGDRDLGKLRDYQLLAKLGQGGMGTVYKARHLKLDRLVALKVLPSDRMKDEQSVARFHREMKAVGSLDHPNIVRAHDAGEADDKHFLVMELVNGIDISALIKQQGVLPIREACELIRQSAVGLEHAHENGLVHRDIKPSNLMLTNGGVVKVLDLGLARLLSEVADDESRDDERKETSSRLHARLDEADDFQAIGDELTGTDQVMGTPDYMAPEQCTDAHHVDIRSDIYSLGATLYKLLTGHAPYTGERFDSLAKKIIGLTTQPVPPITQQRDDLPDGLVSVIERMLAKEPEDRYTTPAEVARALLPYSVGHNVARFVDTRVDTPTTPPSEARVPTPPSVAKSTLHLDRQAPAAAPPHRVWPWVLAAGAAGAVFLGVILLQLQTPYGLLTVDVPEEARENVRVEVRSGNQAEVADKQSGWKIRLTSGTWKVTLDNASDRFTLDRDEVTITRNGVQQVKVMLKHDVTPTARGGEVISPTISKNIEPAITVTVAAPEYDSQEVATLSGALMAGESNLRIRTVKTLGDATKTDDGVLVMVMDSKAFLNLGEYSVKNLKSRKVVGIGYGSAKLFGELGLKIRGGACAHGCVGPPRIVVQGNKLLKSDSFESPFFVFEPPLLDPDNFHNDVFFGMYVGENKPLRRELVDIMAIQTVDNNYAPVVRQGNHVLICVDAPVDNWSPAFRRLVREIVVALHSAESPVPTRSPSLTPSTPIQQSKQPGSAKPGEKHDAFYASLLADLTLIDGELPVYFQDDARHRTKEWQGRQPYAVLDGSGEIYLRGDVNPLPSRRQNIGPLRLAIHIPESRTVAGRLFVPKADFSGMVALKFRIEKDKLGKQGRRKFWEAKRDHYQQLLQRDIPGAAWFRHQVTAANRQLGVSPDAAREATRRLLQNRGTDAIRSFELLSGGLAVSENLQLGRILPTTAPAAETVSIDSINGITVRQFDWSILTQRLDPQLDPLAHLIPDDQHALFFSSFPDMAKAIDHATMAGTPVLRYFEPRGEDAQTLSRYQQQLGLPLSALARKLGPQFVRSVAVTGGDPYLRTGADVAILFEPSDGSELQLLLDAQISLAASDNPQAATSETMLGDINVRSVDSPDRSICSYRAMVGGAVVVTNSRRQLERIVSTFRGQETDLAALPEYKFFRDRYSRDDVEETGLLVISDKTIRRWCGPRWRIGASRRLRAAAVMADVQAEHLTTMLADVPSFAPSIVAKHHLVAGRLTVSPNGVQSPTYGTPEFLTPIIELELDKVTQAEANMYARWRDGYQRNWSRFFDPIAVRFAASENKLAADVTVMPLIDNSRYREMVDVSLGAKIDPAATDPHPKSIVHASMALNRESPRVKNATRFAMQLAPQVKIDPLAWIGTTVSLYADEDPFWNDIGQSQVPYLFLMQQAHRLPIALHVEVVDGFKLVVFLAGVRAYIEQTAPGMTVWETRKHGDEPYVRVGPSERAKSRWGALSKLSIYYAATGEALIVALTEPVIQRALDRLAARRRAKADGKPELAQKRIRLGDNVGVRMDGEFVHAVEAMFHEDFDRQMQSMSRGNLPILNEWKRRFPRRDPVELHQQFWRRRLVCPGGGTYRWNDQWQTMESTVYGSPAQPKESAQKLPSPLDRIESGEFGLTFRDHGLQARMVLTNSKVQEEAETAE